MPVTNGLGLCGGIENIMSRIEISNVPPQRSPPVIETFFDC